MIRPSVINFINQYKTQYKKEIEDHLKEHIAPTVKDPPKEIFSLFKTMHNLIDGKYKSVKN